MTINSATFISASVSKQNFPTKLLPEFAFIGRSNVGKSSLINMLANKKRLAKTSSKPGKTLTINHFLINNSLYFVDLPGYGYAGISKKMKKIRDEMLASYLLERKNLICLFVLIDIRLKPQAVDIEFMEWLAIRKVPFVIVFTKIDKISVSVVTKNIELYKENMLSKWKKLPQIFLTSAVSRAGREDILNFINKIL
ncbi:MAG: YihA family ribosome biogenesis GTP-binding protein [Bacteroidia bacterium]|nr:YihA family ribosome biogenesis GTP-binding protein [Bacteroidia bacterium]